MYVRKLQFINTGIKYWIGFLLYYWITRCISFTLPEFSYNRKRISTWYYYLIPDTIIKRIKVGVRYLLNFHINQLITIYQSHIVILDIIIKLTVVNCIGISRVIERLPVITNPCFNILHKCLHLLFHTNRGKIGLMNDNN